MSRLFNSNDKIWIVDFSYYIWSGSYAFTTNCSCSNDPSCEKCKGKGKYPLQNSRGVMTGGLYLVFQQIIDRLKEGWNVVLAFDPPRADLDRTKLLDTYKGQRGEKPEGILKQMELGKEILNLVPNIDCYSSLNAESDDTMAAIAVMYASMGLKVVVASRDKDMFPLLEIDGIDIYRDGGIFNRASFKQKFNFEPGRFNEYLALCGDAADNFNLLKGIGPAAADHIINNTSHILEVFDKHIWEKIPPKYQKKLVNVDDNGKTTFKKDELNLSLQLATLNYNAEYFKTNTNPNKAVFKNKVEQLELKSVLRDLDVLFGEI